MSTTPLIQVVDDDELGISERGVKMQRAQVMAKLGAGSAVELGRLAERLRNLSD